MRCKPKPALIDDPSLQFNEWTSEEIKTSFTEYVKGFKWDISTFNATEVSLYFALQLTYNKLQTISTKPKATSSICPKQTKCPVKSAASQTITVSHSSDAFTQTKSNCADQQTQTDAVHCANTANNTDLSHFVSRNSVQDGTTSTSSIAAFSRNQTTIPSISPVQTNAQPVDGIVNSTAQNLLEQNSDYKSVFSADLMEASRLIPPSAYDVHGSDISLHTPASACNVYESESQQSTITTTPRLRDFDQYTSTSDLDRSTSPNNSQADSIPPYRPPHIRRRQHKTKHPNDSSSDQAEYPRRTRHHRYNDPRSRTSYRGQYNFSRPYSTVHHRMDNTQHESYTNYVPIFHPELINFCYLFNQMTSYMFNAF